MDNATSRKRYSITLDEDMVKALELTAKSVNMKPTEYIKLCVHDRGDLLRKISNLRARLRDVTTASG